LKTQTPCTIMINAAGDRNPCVFKMKDQRFNLYKSLNWATLGQPELADESEIQAFQARTGLNLPQDISHYFRKLNGTNGQYDEQLFQFYALSQLESVFDHLKDWGGEPDYRNIVNTLDRCESCFVIADHCFHMFTYAIRMYESHTTDNEVYVICGDQYKVIAKSFTDFIELYVEKSMELLFEE
jgi:hypothetical protein